MWGCDAGVNGLTFHKRFCLDKRWVQVGVVVARDAGKGGAGSRAPVADRLLVVDRLPIHCRSERGQRKG